VDLHTLVTALEGLARMPARHGCVASRQTLERLRAEVAHVPVPKLGPATTSERRWLENMSELKEQLLQRSPADFLRWDVIRRTMFVGSARYVRHELEALRSDVEWRSRWRKAILEDRSGRPPGFPRYRASSGNLIHHVFHVLQYERTSSHRVSDMECIVEFGGGYGSMCRLVHRLGFRGRYVIVDLPVFLALQRYFLDNTGVARHADIHYVSEPEAALPLVMGNRRLFIATWSYSEVPDLIRHRVAPVMAACSHLLIGFQERFEDLVNHDLETEVRRVCGPDQTWHAVNIPHLPGNRYLFAAPR
jgi:hypothetical protein